MRERLTRGFGYWALLSRSMLLARSGLGSITVLRLPPSRIIAFFGSFPSMFEIVWGLSLRYKQIR